jgi:thioredoxin reductase (NADPH)
MNDVIRDVVIIGTGSAGLTAGIYTARANLKPLILEGLQPGGQLTITTDVENYPGFSDVVQGPWLMDQMKEQALNVGAEIINELVTSVDFSNKLKIITCDSGKIIKTKSVIICTGAQARWLGIESEKKFNGKGVSACATCDGFFYRNKNVAVIGGGNTAVEEALYLSNLCTKVTVIHRREVLRAEKILQDRILSKENVDFLWNYVVVDFVGNDNGLNSLNLMSTKDGSEKSITIDGAFVAIGHVPSTECFTNQILLDNEGYIEVKEKGSTLTNVDGVFAAGDCVDKVYRQAITAAGMGCMAALDAEKWLQE